MATLFRIQNGEVVGVWDDRWRDLLETIGTIVESPRATDIRFEVESGEWVAFLLGTDEEIARGRYRGEVVKQEVEYLEARL